MGGLDQYGAGSFEQQQFRTAGVEVVKMLDISERPIGSASKFKSLCCRQTAPIQLAVFEHELSSL